MNNSSNDSPSGVLIFSVGTQEFSVDLNDILTILTPEKFRAIAGSRAAKKDRFKYNGRKAEIIQLCGLGPGTNVYDTSRLILISIKSRIAGLWVDDIKEIRIIEYNENKMLREELKKILETDQNPVIKRVIKLGDKIVLVSS